MSCPHRDIIYCPLYVAAHEDGGFGCDDGRLDEGGCAVDRDLNYTAARSRLQLAKPRLVAVLSFEEDAAEAVAQRARNMHGTGVH